MRSILVIAAVIVLPACSRLSNKGEATVEAFQRIRVDQSEAEVVAILGSPNRVYEDNEQRSLTWENGELRITTVFRNDKLISHAATLNGLPLVAEIREPAKPKVEPETPAEEPAPTKPRRKASAGESTAFPDIYVRSRHFNLHALSDSAQEGMWAVKGPNDTAPDSGILIGLLVHLDEQRGVGKFVTGLRPIWRTPKRTVRGKLLGDAGKTASEIIAKGGFAVSSINIIRDADCYYGLSLSCMPIDNDKLDAANEYTTTFAGGKGPERDNFDRSITSRDYPIYGVECHFGKADSRFNDRRPIDGIRIYIARGLNER